MSSRGRVCAIRIHPVKGAAAVDLESVAVVPEGLSGDRRKGAAVHLVSLQSVERSGQDGPRANLVLDLPDDDERGWVGQDLAIGDALLRISMVPKHCLGVYAEVVRPGRINLGDSVEPPD